MPNHRFDHRHLLSEMVGDSPPSAPIEAIYVSTKGRPSVAEELVELLGMLDIPVNIMVSTIEDFPDISVPAQSLDILLVRPSKFEIESSLPAHRFSNESCRTLEWDLHNKRNAALALARQRGEKRILLLDDDIRGLQNSHIERAGSALDHSHIAGFAIDGLLDNSVISHICRMVGFSQGTFISGSCLGIDVEQVSSMFPPIYNEDWLLMLGALAKRMVAVVGTVEQLSVEATSYISRALFQEFGEVLAEGRFAALPHDLTAITSIDYWSTYLGSRRRLLAMLTAELSTRNDEAAREARAAVVNALSALNTVLPADCVSYFKLLDEQNERWATTFHSGDVSELVDATSIRPRRSRAAPRTETIWRYGDGAVVTIVCPTFPKDYRPRFAEKTERNHTSALALADLDAAIDLLGELNRLNPTADIRIRSAYELTPKLIAEDLVLVGGVIWNSATERFMQLLELPVRQSATIFADVDDVFVLSDDGVDFEFSPTSIDGEANLVSEDVALFVRAVNPFAKHRSVTICNGVLSRGVVGITQAFVHPNVSGENSRYVKSKFREGTYCALIRVPVFNGEVIPPDITQARNRLFEWTRPHSVACVAP